MFSPWAWVAVLLPSGMIGLLAWLHRRREPVIVPFDPDPPKRFAFPNDFSAVVRLGGTKTGAILLVLHDDGGHTTDEVCNILQLPPSTVSARINELIKQDKVIAVGATRPTRSGRQAMVWRAK